MEEKLIKWQMIRPYGLAIHLLAQCTEVHFASFLSSEFTTMAVMNTPEKKLEKRTSVQCSAHKQYQRSR